MRRFKRPVQLGLCVAAAALATNAVRLAIPGVRAQMASVVPHTVVLAETIVGPDGQRHSGPRQTWAVRSDGSVVLTLGNEGVSRTIRLASGIKILANDKTRAKSTMWTPIEDSWVLDPREGCTKTITGFEPPDKTVVAEDMVAAYRAVRVTRGNTTTWYASEFGCALMKRRMDFGELGASELELVTLIPGDPSAALFAVPADYKEGPPSALAHAVASARCDAQCQEQRRKRIDRIDASYYKHRVR